MRDDGTEDSARCFVHIFALLLTHCKSRESIQRAAANQE